MSITEKLKPFLESKDDTPEAFVAHTIVNSWSCVRGIALNTGLANNEIRKIVWPLLLAEKNTKNPNPNTKVLNRNEKTDQETFRQIKLDVPRSVRNPDQQEKFESFLEAFFLQHEDLCFFQGFADIAWTVYQVMDGETDDLLAHYVLSRLSRDFILREAHRETFDSIFPIPCSLHRKCRSLRN